MIDLFLVNFSANGIEGAKIRTMLVMKHKTLWLYIILEGFIYCKTGNVCDNLNLAKVIAEDTEVPTDGQILPTTALNKTFASANAQLEKLMKTMECIFHCEILCFFYLTFS